MVKAIGLISGGLDSMLAAKLLQQQGIEVIGLAFKSPFFSVSRAKEAAERLKIPLKVLDITEELIKVVRDPKHGRGSQMNPCIDCHILMLKKAAEVMKKEGAHFVFTGEVLGQRPFSQTKAALKLIEREAGLEGLLLRPLSAKLLPKTIPEEKGYVKREGLLAIQGRGRKLQMDLAEKFGLGDYPSPAGGCLLTDPSFSRRLKDLLEHSEEITRRDLELLKIGRHLRLSKDTKAIVGRKEGENRKLQELFLPGDLLMEPKDGPGPVLLLPKGGRESEWPKAAAICLRYSDVPKEKPSRVKCRGKWEGVIETFPMDPLECEDLLI